MGYYMNMTECDFRIKEENFNECLEAIKKLNPGTDSATGFSGGSSHFAWVNTEEFMEAETLEDAMTAWRWQPQYEKYDNERKGEGDITGICFEGQKLGDDKILLDAIAPFVEEDSYIQMSGECGEMWRWSFDGKFCSQKNPRIDWI